MAVITKKVFMAEQRADIPKAIEMAQDHIAEQQGEYVEVEFRGNRVNAYLGTEAIMEQFRDKPAAARKMTTTEGRTV